MEEFKSKHDLMMLAVRVGAAAAIVSGLILLTIGWVSYRSKSIPGDYARVKGTVVNKDYTDSSGKKAALLLFSSKDGMLYSATTNDAVNQIGPGQPVTVAYNPSQPTVGLRVDNDSLRFMTIGSMAVGVIFVVLGSSGLIYSFIRKPQLGPKQP